MASPLKRGDYPHSEPDVMEQEAAAAQAASDAGKKYTKDEVNYRAAGKSPTRCVFCAHYQPGYGTNGCALVVGPVQPGDVCDMYKPAGSSPQNPAQGESITDLVGPKGA